MKVRLFIAFMLMIGFTSCTQKIMCPAYAVEDGQKLEMKTEREVNM